MADVSSVPLGSIEPPKETAVMRRLHRADLVPNCDSTVGNGWSTEPTCTSEEDMKCKGTLQSFA